MARHSAGDTCSDLVEGVLATVGSRAGVVHAPLPKDDPVRRNPNIARAQELLGGWGPKVPLEQGLKATAEYFRGRQA
jgi:UDP-glucuronate decarboxylase